jgi:hypothetical protein
VGFKLLYINRFSLHFPKGSQVLDGRLLKVYGCIRHFGGSWGSAGFTGFFSGAPAGVDHLLPGPDLAAANQNRSLISHERPCSKN